jgi:hypothetical protein
MEVSVYDRVWLLEEVSALAPESMATKGGSYKKKFPGVC